MEQKYTIWSDLNFWEHEDYLRAEYPDMNDEQIAQMASEDLWHQLNDVRTEFDQVIAPELIAIGDIGRWDGRYCGYHDIPDGNLKHCFFPGRDIDNAEWFVDQKDDLRSEQRHHDGTHYVLYRAVKGENTYEDTEHFKHLIWSGKVTERDIDRYTERVGDPIAKLYGWEIATPKVQQSLRDTLAQNAAKSREVFGSVTQSTPQRECEV